MKKTSVKRALSLLVAISLILQAGLFSVLAAPGTSSSGSASLAGQIPGSVNLAFKPNFNENPYGLVVNARRAANGNAQRIVNGWEYAQNNTGASSDVLATHGAAQGTADNPIYVTISWPEPHVFTGTSVMWWISSQNLQSVWPLEVTIEYSTSELSPFPTQPANADATLANRHEALVWHKVDGVSGNVGVEYNGSEPSATNSDWVRNTIWNNYVFAEPVVARHMRLSIVVDKSTQANAGAGINLWEVYGYDDPEATELELISESLFKDLVTDVDLPAWGANESDISWEIVAGNPADYGGDESAALAAARAALDDATGKISRPAFGQSPVKGKIEATATKAGAPDRTKIFDFSVLPLPNKTALDIVDDAVAALDLGECADRTTNFAFPSHSTDGAVFTWETTSSYIWPDGTVLRPPLGAADATGITISVTAGFGSAEATRTWNDVSIPAYTDDTRKIVSAESPTIYSPEGTAPKLPNYLKVAYSDGNTEMRKIQWSGSSTAAQAEQAAKPVGAHYPFTGNVIGDGNGNGFQVTANIIVVEADDPEYGLQVVPSNVPVAAALPLSAVTINDDPNGDQNRLTQNRDGYVNYIINQNCTQYLYQFRTAYGLDTTGYNTPSGWTGKLRGAGAGHYLSALALAINSEIDATQREALVNRMARMTREMRAMQEMTMEIDHPTEDRYWEARDFMGDINLDGSDPGKSGDEQVMGMSLLLGDWIAYAYEGVRTGTYSNNMSSTQIKGILGDPTENQGPKTYGHGYLNAIPPQHLLGNECYAEYSDGGNGVWAPYYGLHKILAGLVEIYYALDGDETEYALTGDYGSGTITGQEVANLALEMASDMGLWISNRFEYRTRAGVRPAVGEPGYDLPGWRDSNWIVFIGGEYGGINETLARLYEITGDERQLSAAEGFWNDGSFANTGFRPFMADLAMNRDSIRILHANQAIPAIVGTLWTYRGNNDPKYWNVAENFWEYNVGRYAWATGNVKGNPGNVEQYVGAYNQSSALMLHNNANETCAAYNLMKLSKALNEHNPDDAKYMDHVERVFTNQIIGSLVPGSTTGQGCYHYPIHLNATRSRGAASSTNSDCCSGTRAEIHVKYQDSIYFTSNDSKTFYVGLYLPSTARWDEQDVVIKQETVWPSEKSTFKITTGAHTGAFEMKFRVPYWATKGFSIKLNGVPINNGVFEPSTYVSTGIRAWSDSDVIVVEMPYEVWIDYLPGKQNGKWLGSVMYGPVLMAADGTNASERITSYSQADLFIDSFMDLDNMDITVNGRETLGTTPTGVTAITRNVPTMSAVIGGVERPLRPHYYVSSNYTTYLYINVAGGWLSEKASLFSALLRGKALVDSGDYTAKSSRFLAGALASGADVYASESSDAPGTLAAIDAIGRAILRLESDDPDVFDEVDGQLNQALLAAKAILGDGYTWDSFAALQSAIASVEETLAGTPTLGELLLAAGVLEEAQNNLILLSSLNRDELLGALGEAYLESNPLNTGSKLFPEHEYTNYTRLSWQRFTDALAYAEDVMGNIGKNYNQSEIDAAANALNGARNQLLDWERADEREPLEAVIAEAKGLRAASYTPEQWGIIQDLIEYLEEDRLSYASLTFIEMYDLIAEMREAMSLTKPSVVSTCVVSFNTNGGSSVLSQTVVSGMSAKKPADPVKAGYTFGGWFTNAALTNPYDFGQAVNVNTTLFALWTEGVDDPDVPVGPPFPFTDVKSSDWFYNDVAYVYENDLMNGTSASRFSPGMNLTRGMIVTILYRDAGEPDASGLSNPFSDVKAGQYYTDAIKWAADNDIVTGYNGMFRPDNNVTRQDLATILFRYAEFAEMKLPATRGYPGFADATLMADYAKDAVEALYKAEIINGKPNNRFDPQGNATRAETAAMMHRFFEVSKG